jgi:hypothetical protein
MKSAFQPEKTTVLFVGTTVAFPAATQESAHCATVKCTWEPGNLTDKQPKEGGVEGNILENGQGSALIPLQVRQA